MAVWAWAPPSCAFLVSHSKNHFPQPRRHWLLYAFPGKRQGPSREALAENGDWRRLLTTRTEVDVLFVFSCGPPDATAGTTQFDEPHLREASPNPFEGSQSTPRRLVMISQSSKAGRLKTARLRSGDLPRPPCMGLM